MRNFLLAVGIAAFCMLVSYLVIYAAPSVPECPHDTTKWHSLVERNPDGSIACTYGHEHGDDPKALDYVFGPLPSYMNEIGGYPWETSHAENTDKHRTFKWYVVDRPDTCKHPGGSGPSFNQLRFLGHDNSLGWTVRFHSYFFQAIPCDPNDPTYTGLFQTGGWGDWGWLTVDGVHVPLPDDPEKVAGRLRQHQSPSSTSKLSVWYGYSYPISDPVVNDPNALLVPHIAFGFTVSDPWGPVDPNDPFTQLFYEPVFSSRSGSVEYYNASNRVPLHRLRFVVTKGMDGLDGATDGVANYRGFMNRNGQVVPGCTEISLDCIPFIAEGLKQANHEYKADSIGEKPREYDVLDPSTGKSLIVYPN